MRLTPVLLLWSLAGVVLGQARAGGQPPSGTGSLFRTTRFEATVVVRKHNTGADLVEVTVLKPTYSQTLLRQQIQLLGQELRSEPRGLQVYGYRLDPADAGSQLVKASFAVDGLIDHANGVLRLQPIARAFSLKSDQDAIEALMVQFEGENPTPGVTLQACAPPQCQEVMLEGRAADTRYGVEYRMKLLGHDPSKISIPDYKQDVPKTPLPQDQKPTTDWTLIALLFVAALALGALVYSLLSRGRPRPPVARA